MTETLTVHKRIFGLDILRAFAIMLVVYSHSIDVLGHLTDDNVQLWRILDGVTLFFVLSGFLIGRIILNIYFSKTGFGTKRLFSFWGRRWIRTIPIYFICLTVIISAKYLIFGYEDIANQALYPYYFFIQNLWYPHPHFYPEAWSLSVEEWFYFTFPLILFVSQYIIKQRSPIVFLSVVLIFLLFGIVYRYYVCQQAILNGININSIYLTHIHKVVISRLDSIMYGVLGAYIFVFYNNFWNRYLNLFFFLGIGCLLLSLSHFWYSVPLMNAIFLSVVTSLGALLLLPKLNSLKSSTKPRFREKFITLISLISYSMYLSNLWVKEFLKFFINPNDFPILFIVFFWSSLLLVAYLLYRLIEQPILKLRDKYLEKDSI